MCPQSLYDFHFILCTSELLVKDCDLRTGTILLRDGREVRIQAESAGRPYLEDALHRLTSGQPPLTPIRHMVEILRVINAADK